MSFLTYGQAVNGIICICKATCMVGCVCGCPACASKGNIITRNEKPPAKSFKELLEQTKLPWVKVEGSSNINAYAYQNGELYVQFIGGSIGKYLDVIKEDFDLLQAAESKGKFISNIIKSKYKYEKVMVTI